MKKIYVMTLGILANLAAAQVGVNTPNPQGMFHLDGKKNNEASGPVSPANQAGNTKS